VPVRFYWRFPVGSQGFGHVEQTKSDLLQSVEQERAAMVTLLENHKAAIQELSHRRTDALIRRRDVYAKLATNMRALLRASTSREQPTTDPREILAAYDEAYIWASEPVAVSILDLVDPLERKAKAGKDAKLMPPDAPGYLKAPETAQSFDPQARERYQRCLLEIRKDCGFPASTVEYRVITF
jgi:hypothetical protein